MYEEGAQLLLNCLPRILLQDKGSYWQIASFLNSLMSTYPDFTRILNQKLLEQERSATWLAKKLDLHPGTVNRWLNHEIRPATPELVIKIAELLQVGDAKERQALLASAGYAYADRLSTSDLKSKPQSVFLTPQNDLQKHNLPPQPTTFVGREEELAQLADLLAQPDVKLLTIIGFGGVGKTRLALKIATRLVDDYTDGVWFVSLVGIDGGTSPNTLNPLVMSLANVLAVVFLGQEEPEEQLLNYLQNKEMLLVFDNVEHLLSLSDFFSRLLVKCPRIKLLITSRERLRLVEEWLFPLTGLALPTSTESITADTLHLLSHYDALQLFAQRARRVQPAFDLNTNIEEVLHICQLVEGIPLGIELAAAWLRQMPLAQIASEIEQSSDILHSPLRNQPERHRSFRTVFEHSWELLTPDEQDVLMKLSVFRGGFRRPEAEAVTGATLQTLIGLVDKSFVRLTESGRYEIHERIRQYSEEKLRKQEKIEKTACDQHCKVYLAFLRAQKEHIYSAQELMARSAIGAEIDNIRTAWKWALDQQYIDEVRTSLQTLLYFYFISDWLREAKDTAYNCIISLRQYRDSEFLSKSSASALVTLGLALAFLGQVEALTGSLEHSVAAFKESLSILRQFEVQSPYELAHALLAYGTIYHNDRDFTMDILQQSLALFQKVGTKSDKAKVLFHLGHTAWTMGNYDQAKQYCDASLRLSQSPTYLGYILLNLGMIDQAYGNYSSAESLYQQTLSIWQSVNHQQGLAYVYTNLSDVLKLQGKLTLAQNYLEQSLEISQRNGFRTGYITALIYLGEMAEHTGDFDSARRYFQTTLELDALHTVDSAHALIALGRISLIQNDVQTAIAQLTEALKFSFKIKTIPQVLESLVEIARYYAKSDSKQRARELLSLVYDHSIAGDKIKQTIAKLLAELATEEHSEAILVAQQRASTLTLEQVAEQLLSELS